MNIFYRISRVFEWCDLKFRNLGHRWHDWNLRRKSIEKRLVYSAYSYCDCGAPHAYDPAGERWWDCSDILLDKAIAKGEPGSLKHSDVMPFVFWDLKSEGQPSAMGATTRGKRKPPKKQTA